MASIQIGMGTAKRTDDTTRELAESRFARDNSETRFLDWRAVPEEIAVLPELTLGGVQMDITQAVVRNSQSARDSKIKAENDSMWRMAA